MNQNPRFFFDKQRCQPIRVFRWIDICENIVFVLWILLYLPIQLVPPPRRLCTHSDRLRHSQVQRTRTPFYYTLMKKTEEKIVKNRFKLVCGTQMYPIYIVLFQTPYNTFPRCVRMILECVNGKSAVAYGVQNAIGSIGERHRFRDNLNVWMGIGDHAVIMKTEGIGKEGPIECGQTWIAMCIERAWIQQIMPYTGDS